MSKSMVGRIPTKEDAGPGSVGRDECCGNPLRGCADCPPPKKLTFEEWWEQNNAVLKYIEGGKTAAAAGWRAAKENK